MAFAVRNLSVLAYAQGFTLWHYKLGPLDLSEAAKSGFFNPCADLLKVGDIMMISGRDGGALVFVSKASDHEAIITPITSIAPIPA
jgi:hypothetical protein